MYRSVHTLSRLLSLILENKRISLISSWIVFHNCWHTLIQTFLLHFLLLLGWHLSLWLSCLAVISQLIWHLMYSFIKYILPLVVLSVEVLSAFPPYLLDLRYYFLLFAHWLLFSLQHTSSRLEHLTNLLKRDPSLLIHPSMTLQLLF